MPTEVYKLRQRAGCRKRGVKDKTRIKSFTRVIQVVGDYASIKRCASQPQYEFVADRNEI